MAGISVEACSERSVQTSTASPSPTASQSQASDLQSPVFSVDESSLSSLSSLGFSTSHDISALAGSSPSALLQAQRTMKPPPLGRNLPSQGSIEKSRNVSLPETDAICAAKAELRANTLRIVSMPEQRHLMDTSTSTDSQDASLCSVESYLSVDGDRSDSIIIIEHDGGLSDAFLRPQAVKELPKPDSTPVLKADEDGWISWASSPPRPIPALHGPLSLPYARCPSGAEGTIIEEPGSLPRMIWGLGHDGNAPVDRSKSMQPTHSQRKTPHTAQQSLTSKPVQSAYHRPADNQRRSQPTEPVHRSPLLPRNETNAHIRGLFPPEQVANLPYPCGDDAIILENLLQDYHAKSWEAGSDFKDLPGTGAQEPLYLQNLLPTPPVDTHPSILHGFGLTSPNNLGPMLAKGPGSSMKLSSRPAAGSPLPQIFIEPRSSAPRQRLSAMEIAQQYHRQQLQKQSNMLPTPPSSSSPLWSSAFSPYQEYMSSPTNWTSPQFTEQALAGIRNQTIGVTDANQELRRQVYEQLHGTNSSDALAPSIQIGSHSRAQTHKSSEVSSNTSPAETLRDLLARRDALLASVTASPPRPRPPPNTPRGSISARGQATRPGQPYFARPPSSPVSPEARSRSLSAQQPRSIPLARLIQRRLSAVPEEESVSALPGFLPSHDEPTLRTRHNSVDSPGKGHVPLQYTHPNSTAGRKTPSPMHAGLTIQSGTVAPALGLHLAPTIQPGTAKVRLPSAPLQTRNRSDVAPASRSKIGGGREKEDRGREDRPEGVANERASGAARKKVRGKARKTQQGPIAPAVRT